jgi:hypothetical protein
VSLREPPLNCVVLLPRVEVATCAVVQLNVDISPVAT